MAVIQTERNNQIRWATFHRPEARNSINFETMDDLEELLDQVEKEEETRCLVFCSGDEEIFISGGDLKEFHTLKSADEAKRMAERMIVILDRLERLPCWTIACIDGAAYGGGCEIMLAFDFRIASANAVFGFTQGRFYLPPGWGGLTRLVERVGRSTALRWLAERAVVDAETAREYRLVDRLTPGDSLIDRTQEWAETLAFNDRNYIRTLKRGASRVSGKRGELIREELAPFSHFWEDERHHMRVEKFLNRDD